MGNVCFLFQEKGKLLKGMKQEIVIVGCDNGWEEGRVYVWDQLRGKCGGFYSDGGSGDVEK